MYVYVLVFLVIVYGYLNIFYYLFRRGFKVVVYYIYFLILKDDSVKLISWLVISDNLI